jgi:pimeloyl-ACP methyl ester carboxylesterase
LVRSILESRKEGKGLILDRLEKTLRMHRKAVVRRFAVVQKRIDGYDWHDRIKIPRKTFMPNVISKDGTKIAYDKTGKGCSALILVEGATGVRAAGFSTKIDGFLSPYFTVYSYDRRGRGQSTDTKPYSVQREVEDIEALINAAGGAACLCGKSSGGALVLEAAIVLKGKVKKLAIYEVPYDSSEGGVKAWREYRIELKELLMADRRGDALTLFMKFVGVPDQMIAGMRTKPMWPMFEAIAPTLQYDAEVLGENRIVPADRASQITSPTLILDGGASLVNMPFMHDAAEALAKAIPNARRKTLEGQGHDVDSKVLAPVLVEFFGKGN